MRAVVQRVSAAQVTVDGTVRAEIGAGLCVLLGVARGDIAADAERLAGKLARLRVFEEPGGRLDLKTLHAELTRLHQEGTGKPLLAPHADSRSQDMLDALTALEQEWAGSRRAAVAPQVAAR